LRISFVLPTDSLVGGVRVVAIYAERLRRRGHEVFVVSQPPRRPTPRERVRALVKEGRWLAAPKKGRSFFDGLDIPHGVLETRRPVTDADLPDADVVVATWWETAEPVAALSAAKGSKAYFVQDYGANAGQPLDQVAATWRLPMHKITISPYLLRLIERECGDTDVTLAVNGVDLEQFNAPPRGKQPQPTVGLMYSTRPQKGLPLMLEASRRAARELPGLRIAAFGTEPIRPDLPLLPGSTYVRDAAQATLRDIYGSCDGWLFGSSLEGFGLPILEAMACRTPVVGTPAGAAPELIAEGGGVLVKADDPQDMARGIVAVCGQSDADWRAMSEAALATARRYTWDAATDAFEAGLKRAIEKNAVSSAAW
jgi:glycosyltransferase involved in cell wall biosynthesis